MNTAAAADDRQAVHSDAPKLDPDVLATVIDETARRVEARAARPSPVHLRNWEEIERFAEKAARSGMVPKDYIGKPDAIAIAVQMGSELGLAPVQSVQNIAVINGRPAIWGDAIPGLIRASGICKWMKEWHEGEGDELTYHFETARKDDPNPIHAKFSVADAKRAKLWQENPTVKRKSRDGGTYEADSGPWYSYPDRMLQMRARGFGARDGYPDVLKGLLSAEEARDIPWEDTGLSIVPPVATAVPLKPAAASTPRAERKVDPTVYETPPKSTPPTNGKPRHSVAPPPGAPDADWRACLDWVAPAMAKLRTRQHVVDVANGPTCSDIIAHGPGWAKAELDELLNENYRRFPDEPEAEELPEVEIAGEEKLAAGD